MPNIVADFPASPPPPADGKLKLHNTLARNVKIISFLFFLLSKAHCPTRFKAHSGSSIQRESIRSSDKQGPCLRFCTFKHIWSYCDHLCWKKTQISDEEKHEVFKGKPMGLCEVFLQTGNAETERNKQTRKKVGLVKRFIWNGGWTLWEKQHANKRQEHLNTHGRWIWETVFLHADTWQHPGKSHGDRHTRMLTAALSVI